MCFILTPRKVGNIDFIVLWKILLDIVSPDRWCCYTRPPVDKSTIQRNFSIDNFTKAASFFQLGRQCACDGRLYSSADKLELGILPHEKSTFTAINVAINNKTYTGNHVKCPDISRDLTNFDILVRFCKEFYKRKLNEILHSERRAGTCRQQKERNT